MDLLMVVLVSGLIASLLKIAGGVLYGSNTLFVDAATSFANIISLFTTLAFNRITVIPPDSDHHFGHERYEYAGILSTLIVYSFVAGVALSRLYFVKEYIVLPEATLYAILAMAIYSIANSNFNAALAKSEDVRPFHNERVDRGYRKHICKPRWSISTLLDRLRRGSFIDNVCDLRDYKSE